MVAEVSLSAVSYFLPILAFLLVFIVIYALLKKTGVLGGTESVMLFVSFILASFFVVEASLVEFVEFSSAWFGVIVIGVFFLIAVLGFIPVKEPFAFLSNKNWFSWLILGLIVAFFIISSAYVFNWTINWDLIDGKYSDWWGMILLLVVALVVSFTVTKK